MTQADVFEQAINIYVKNLWSSSPVLNYLVNERKLSEQTLRKYNIGYACNNILKNEASRKGWLKAAIQHKIVKQGKDFFNGYITFPVFAPHNFGFKNIYGRKFKGEGVPHMFLPLPKDIPYNIAALAKQAIVITESPIDALTLAQVNINACAAGGARLNKQAASLFKDKVCYIAFDTDFSGKLGAIKLAEKLLPLVKSVYIIDLPTLTEAKVDINSFFVQTEKASDRFRFLVKNSVPIKNRIFAVAKNRTKKYEEDRIDIVQIGKKLLEKTDYLDKGNQLWVRCPRHNNGQELNRSLWIGGNKNMFYCFGCHTGGPPTQLVSWYLGLDKNTAAEWIQNYFM